MQPAEPLELAAAVNALLRIRRSEEELRALNAILGGQVKDRTAELTRAIGALKASADRMRSMFQTSYIFQGYMAADGILLDATDAQGAAFAVYQPPAGEKRPELNGAGPGELSYVTHQVTDSAGFRYFYGRVLGWTFEP